MSICALDSRALKNCDTTLGAMDLWCCDDCVCLDCVFFGQACTGDISPAKPISVRQYGDLELAEGTAQALAQRMQKRKLRWRTFAQL
jgi:hypothetical protein